MVHQPAPGADLCWPGVEQKAKDDPRRHTKTHEGTWKKVLSPFYTALRMKTRVFLVELTSDRQSKLPILIPIKNSGFETDLRITLENRNFLAVKTSILRQRIYSD